MRKLTAPQILLLSFLTAVLCGSILLSLPIAVKGDKPLSIIDSLFTATSAICVTGLVVKDTGTFFSSFGQGAILFFIQLGGLGIMTFSTLFAIILGKKLSMSQNMTIKSTLGYSRIESPKDLIKYIVLLTFTIEFIGAGLLYFRWSQITQWSPILILKRAIFHSVSAFCNAGFSLFSNSLTDFRADVPTMFIISALIIIGGLGFVVILNIPRLRHSNKIHKRINLQTKIVLAATLFLLVAGALAVFLLENNYALGNMPAKEKALSCIFTSVTPRTAGFNVLPTGGLRAATKFVLMVLIFIGASPGSTGGGIKTVTAIVLLLGFASMLKGRDRIFLFNRTIERDMFRRAVAVFVLAMGLIFVSTLLLTITEKALLGSNSYFLNLFFESTSAFGTCGLTTGITGQLSPLGKLIIIITMFLGRVGPLTAVLALAARKDEKIGYRYPEEKIMVG